MNTITPSPPKNNQTQVFMPADYSLCQTDYPLDWYQEEFIPYAEEYLALPDRKIATVINWMRPYIKNAQAHFGESLLLLAHYYMGGEIVNLIKIFGGEIGDSYQLALMAANHPEKKMIVESAVHFMAESISLLAHSDQRVYITNPKAGCTMELYAKDYMIEPMLEELNTRYGKENIVPICYMNTSGRVKALAGAQNGAVCTSSNVKKIVEWARKQHKKIVFIPDKYMGQNAAHWVGISPKNIAYWPSGNEGALYSLEKQDKKTIENFDRAEFIIFSSECPVHSYLTPAMVQYWQQQNFHVVVHPECRPETVQAADSVGSTAFIYNQVLFDQAHTHKYAIGTEKHMVDNMKAMCASKNIEVQHVGDAKISQFKGMGCGCATMSRNDPPHLVATLDLLRQGKLLDFNQVQAGDVVNEFSGQRTRLNPEKQNHIKHYAKIALENMIKITES